MSQTHLLSSRDDLGMTCANECSILYLISTKFRYSHEVTRSPVLLLLHHVLPFFFKKWLYPFHTVEVPGPGIESEPQLSPAAAAATPDPLTHCARPGPEPVPPQQPELLQL